MGSTPSHNGADWPTAHKEAHAPYLRIHAVNIYVRDQDRSLRFYVDKLGFEVALDAHQSTGERWVAVTPPDGGTVLSLIAPRPGTFGYKLIGRATQVVFVTEDVAAKFRDWSQRGVRFRQTPRLRRVKLDGPASQWPPTDPQPLANRAPVWGGVFARFEDIDRNSFELVSFDRISQAVEAKRRAVAQKLESERRAAQELEIAKEVQARLFPQTLPQLKTLEYAGLCIQARQVGGDYYDFLHLGRERIGLVIGDIAGKGIAAALQMANLQANLRGQCAIALDEPQVFLRSVNRLFFENSIETAYATLFFGDYDDQARRLRYANCGHLCALLLRPDHSFARLDSTATVLGMFKDWDCSIEEHELHPGDTLALYTDGVTESTNYGGAEFGEQGLMESLLRHHHLPPNAMLHSIVDEVQTFSPHEQRDDITLIVAKCV
jgi:serine phosphatase RsbU (regulator of sigma subunit)/catechol 2,3-dioxygenase-like lactoylglutathione lyase family enzyme